MPKLIYHDSDGIDKSFNLGSEPVLIGRANECQIQTQDAMVSRRHATITWEGGYYIQDLGSSNGVYIGHEKVQKAQFRPGDVVTCGSLVMRMIPDTARPSVNQPSPSNPAPIHSASTGPAQVIAAPPRPAPAQTAQSAPAPPPAYADPRAGRTPPVGEPSFGGADGVERKRREQAEAALLEAAQRVKQAEAEVAQLRRRVSELEAQPRGGGGGDDETAKLRRQVEQLQADNRRMRAGAPAGGDAARVGELTDALRRAESERDAARAGGGRGGGMDPAAADAAIALGDSLAELRSSLRAASDEATVLTAPAQSVTVVAEALGQATEQLESARANLRLLGKLLGVA